VPEPRLAILGPPTITDHLTAIGSRYAEPLGAIAKAN
jgi:hypothetical protein